jgi:hypothetical protein
VDRLAIAVGARGAQDHGANAHAGTSSPITS